MDSNSRTKTLGVVGMAAAVLWLVALTVEYQYDLLPPGDGNLLYYADQGIFFLAMAGYLLMLLGMWRSKAAGEGRFGKISLGIFITGISALLIAQVVQWITHNADFFLYPVGGIFQLLLTGIAVVAAKRWNGWQRFAPLLQGLYYLFLFVQLAALNQSPTQLTEGLWQMTWFITSLALFTS